MKPEFPHRPPPPASIYILAGAAAAISLWGIFQNYTPWGDLPRPVEAPANGLVPNTNPETASRTARENSYVPPGGTARGDVRALFSGDDYPVEALRKNEQGTVQTQLSVGTNGRVTQCRILRSSGHRSLDEATCSILSRRARFSPARNALGDEIPSTITTPPIRWQLAE